MKKVIPKVRCCLPLLVLFPGVIDAAAFYNPQAQRWINRDPIEKQGGIGAKSNPTGSIQVKGLL